MQILFFGGEHIPAFPDGFLGGENALRRRRQIALLPQAVGLLDPRQRGFKGLELLFVRFLQALALSLFLLLLLRLFLFRPLFFQVLDGLFLRFQQRVVLLQFLPDQVQ